jgi:regulator of protease activity HflC (stomatin/prohibitin superfamily)
MPASRSNSSDILDALPAPPSRFKRLAILIGVPAGVGLLLLIILWNLFIHQVPPGQHLVIISKNGDPLDPGEVLAKPGQKGIQKDVLGEGYHFVWPIIYSTEREANTVIPPGQVGIVTAQGGRPPRDGRVLAEQDDEQGIRRQVLLPGAYRLNLKGYSVKTVAMVKIEPGFVGIKRRLLGVDGATQFATRATEKGIIKDDILQPGIYPVNTKEYEVLKCEVGIYQTTYHYIDEQSEKSAGQKSTALTFYGQDGSPISLDCTIEWEIKPEHWPVWLTRFRNHQEIEQKVVDLHARQICQVRGSRFGAQDFLDGEKREKFQSDFRTELDKVCKAENVVVRSAFIRNIIIPDKFLGEKRDQRLASETKLTAEALTLTAQTQAEVAEAKKQIDARVAEVQAETTRMVAVVERETENVKQITEAEIDKLKAEYGAKIAELEAKRKQVVGEADAESTKLKETAKSSLYKMKMDVFNRDSDAYLRYTMAQKLNPKLQLRLFQAGPGTLWTNMGNKNMNFMLPLPSSEKSVEVKLPEKTKTEK